MQDMIKMEGVVKIYGQDGLAVRALRGVNLAVEAGELTVVMGPVKLKYYLIFSDHSQFLSRYELNIGGITL